jgi:ABC-type nickel/cobalt efflux system permease component RcnA
MSRGKEDGLVDSQTLLIVMAAIVVVVLVAAWMFYGQRRRVRLRHRFGPEYDRVVAEAGSPAKAEALLSKRAARVGRFKLHPLNRDQADAFAQEWRRVQARFVDDPDAAVTDADRLLTQVMTARGYPLEDFDRRADDVSVDHPHVVEHYRTARALVVKRQRGHASTEELRQAIVHYRALFDDLLEVGDRHHRRAS